MSYLFRKYNKMWGGGRGGNNSSFRRNRYTAGETLAVVAVADIFGYNKLYETSNRDRDNCKEFEGVEAWP